MTIEHEEFAEWPAPDEIRQAAWPLAELILAATPEGSRVRKEAMSKLMRCVEEIRSSLARGKLH